MTKIISPTKLTTKEIANKIQYWFELRKFEVEIVNLEKNYFIKARKSTPLRIAISADHALIVGVRSEEFGTEIEVKQGSWNTKIISSAVWFALTGGVNILLAGWSFVLQLELEKYIRELLQIPPEVHTSLFGKKINAKSNLLSGSTSKKGAEIGNSSASPHSFTSTLSDALASTTSAIKKTGQNIGKKTSNFIQKLTNSTDSSETEGSKIPTCRKCGTSAPIEGKFCANCGARL